MGETCTQYISLTAEDLKGLNMDETGSKYVCSPPPRDRDSWEAIWNGIQTGVFQTFSSDHCPFYFEGELGKKNPKARTAFRWVPNGVPGVEVRMPIRCPDVAEGEPPPAVRVDARILTGTRDGHGAAQEPAGGEEPRAVGAVPLGELARFGGTCSSADAALPRGWRSVLPATVVRADDDGLRLRVSGPPDAEPLLLLDPDPDGWLSPGSTRVTAGSAGDITVDVGRPEIQCDRPREAPLPTTVTLFFRDPPSGPPRPHLVRVGTNLSSWLLRQWDLACPTPDG